MCRELDQEFLRSAELNSYPDGTTCLISWIKGSKLTLANIGDSSAILIRDNKTFEVTSEQTPNRMDEYKRINSMNGLVLQVGDTYRVGGVLAVSRAIGDLHYKDVVISEPEVTCLDLTVDD